MVKTFLLQFQMNHFPFKIIFLCISFITWLKAEVCHMLYVSDIGTNETKSVALGAQIISATDFIFRLLAFFRMLKIGCKRTRS